MSQSERKTIPMRVGHVPTAKHAVHEWTVNMSVGLERLSDALEGKDAARYIADVRSNASMISLACALALDELGSLKGEE